MQPHLIIRDFIHSFIQSLLYSKKQDIAVQRHATYKLTAEHYRKHRKALAAKGIVQQNMHSISTKNNIYGTKERWTA